MKANFSRTMGNKRINATVSLDDECKNGVCTWSVTGEYSEQLKSGRWVNISCGAIHDTILKYFPELSDFVALHLSNIHGQPMYPVENGHYWLTRNGVEKAAEYLRIPVEIAQLLSGDEDLFRYQLKQLGIVDHWEEESRKAIEHLEQITGKKFVNPYNENDEKFVLRYTQEELDDMANMKRHFIITIKEFGNDKLLKTEYTGNIDHNGLIKFFGLHNPDVEWYIIEEVKDK